MSHLDEWAHLIAKQLKSEAERVGAQAKSELYEDAARETFIRVVLEPFLPDSYAVGSGRVIDASGAISSPQDIVIYRGDYPQFNMPGSHNVFIYESVLATIQVSSKLVRKSFFDAMDQCASLGQLEPVIEPAVRRALALKMSMKLNANQQFVHADPLNTDRFDLIGRPQSFIYAFSGFQTSEKQLTENLEKWIDHYHQDHDSLHMKSLPSVIATQGCFAWRNTVPFTIKNPVLMGVGPDLAPLRLIVLQLLHALNRRLQNTSDGYGIRSNIAPYLAQFEPPAISQTVGRALNPGEQKPMSQSKAEPTVTENQTPGIKQPAQTPAASEYRVTESSVEMANPVATTHQVEARVSPPPSAAETADSHVEAQAPVVPGPAVIENQPQLPETAAPSEPPAHSASDASEGMPSSQPEVAPEQPVGSVNNPGQAAAAETESNAPVIEDRSRARALRANATTGQATEDRSRPRPSPLSLYDNEGDGDVEEYQFSPIEPAVTQAEDEAAESARASDEDAFEATQEIDLSQINHKTGAVKGADSKAEPVSSPQGQAVARDEETDNEFMDTLVETADSLAQKKPEPAPRKSQYVTESLLQ